MYYVCTTYTLYIYFERCQKRKSSPVMRFMLFLFLVRKAASSALVSFYVSKDRLRYRPYKQGHGHD